MKRFSLNNKGFEIVSVLVVAGVIVILGLVTVRIARHNKTTKSQTATTSEVPKVSSKSDVAAAKKSLDDIKVDNDLNGDSLDSDLNALK